MGNPECRRRSRSTKKRSDNRLRIVFGKRYQFEGELAKELGCSFSAVANFVNQRSVWIPYDLPPQKPKGRVEVAKILLEMEKTRSFRDVLETSDEKWSFTCG